MFISGLSQLVFHLLTGKVGGKNCHFRLRSTTSGTHYCKFPSTVDNFRYTFRSPRYSFIASYDAKNELKRKVRTSPSKTTVTSQIGSAKIVFKSLMHGMTLFKFNLCRDIEKNPGPGARRHFMN